MPTVSVIILMGLGMHGVITLQLNSLQSHCPCKLGCDFLILYIYIFFHYKLMNDACNLYALFQELIFLAC